MLEQYVPRKGRLRRSHLVALVKLQRDGNLHLNELAYQLGRFSTRFVRLWFDRVARTIEIVPAQEDAKDTFRISGTKLAGAVRVGTKSMMDYLGWNSAELTGHYYVSPLADGGLRVELIPSRRWEAEQAATTRATKASDREKREDMAPDAVAQYRPAQNVVAEVGGADT